MPSTTACLEQAFAQENGELFIAKPRPSRLLAVTPEGDMASDVGEPGADRPSVGRMERQPAALPTDRAA